jgi:hypothetical protein
MPSEGEIDAHEARIHVWFHPRKNIDAGGARRKVAAVGAEEEPVS